MIDRMSAGSRNSLVVGRPCLSRRSSRRCDTVAINFERTHESTVKLQYLPTGIMKSSGPTVAGALEVVGTTVQ